MNDKHCYMWVKKIQVPQKSRCFLFTPQSPLGSSQANLTPCPFFPWPQARSSLPSSRWSGPLPLELFFLPACKDKALFFSGLHCHSLWWQASGDKDSWEEESAKSTFPIKHLIRDICLLSLEPSEQKITAVNMLLSLYPARSMWCPPQNFPGGLDMQKGMSIPPQRLFLPEDQFRWIPSVVISPGELLYFWHSRWRDSLHCTSEPLIFGYFCSYLQKWWRIVQSD